MRSVDEGEHVMKSTEAGNNLIVDPRLGACAVIVEDEV